MGCCNASFNGGRLSPGPINCLRSTPPLAFRRAPTSPSLCNTTFRAYPSRSWVVLPPLPSRVPLARSRDKAVDTVLVAGANGARLTSATGDTSIDAGDANGSVVLAGGSAVLGAAPTVSFTAASRDGVSSRGMA